ncbi:MAG: hypothetical protein LBD45_02930, partial [Bacteroidales bacterium]|nr:hypothetical protein [Bacteroidales bacterium]
MPEKLILTAVEHPLWGNILQPVLVEETETDTFIILEVATEKSAYFSALTPVEQEMVRIAGKYSDKALMKLYSREKVASHFLKKVSKATIEHYIRPCIENYHRQLVQQLPQSGMSFFMRANNSIRTLYSFNEITVTDGVAETVFNFIKDSELGFRYFIQVKWNNEIISLKNQMYIVLCFNPAIVVVDLKLFVFEDIDAKKLQPFFTKSNILVPQSSEKDYIDKFVVNCIKKYEVFSDGFDITELKPQKTARLLLEHDWNQRPVLRLVFQYGEHCFQINAVFCKNVYAEHFSDGSRVVYFFRDSDWEKQMINRLCENGLQSHLDNYFVVCQENTDQLPDDEVYALVDWLRDHQDVLQHFSFEQGNMQKIYYTGEISLESMVNSGYDWFDFHCIVIVGKYKIPFTHFRRHILDGNREYTLPDNIIFILPAEWFIRYYELMLFGKKNGENIRLKRYHYPLIEDLEYKKCITLVDFSADFLKPVPEGLQAELRPYQQKGFSWLLYLKENNFGGCLADDMGLGKTLQTIAMLLHIYGDSINKIEKLPPTLIVIPTSLLHNWMNELKRFAPSLKIYNYSGIKRIKTKDIGKIFSRYHIVLTSYGILRNDINFIQSVDFHHLILDESQYVKNPSSQIYKTLKKVTA